MSRNIAEGFGCRSHGEFARFLEISRRSLNELMDSFRSAQLKGYVSADDVAPIYTLGKRLFPALSSLIAYLRRTPSPDHRTGKRREQRPHGPRTNRTDDPERRSTDHGQPGCTEMRKTSRTERQVDRMIENARYAHTNLIARDWRALAAFYTSVFDCTLVPPERDYAGPVLEAGTGVRGAALRGVHLRLPGYGADGPTLEIFSYSRLADGPTPAVNRLGFAHIAFQVASVVDARQAVLYAGGRPVGDIVTLTTADGRKVTWCYVTDPEGNVIELQSWSA